MEKEDSSYSMNTDASYCSTVLSRNERKKWDYLCRQQQEEAASMKQDEDHVEALISRLKNNMTNPFD